MEFLHHGGYSLKESAVISRYAVEALYYLESYKLLDDCLSQKIDMTKAEVVASFDSCRYSLLAYHILLYLEKSRKDSGCNLTDNSLFANGIIKGHLSVW